MRRRSSRIGSGSARRRRVSAGRRRSAMASRRARRPAACPPSATSAAAPHLSAPASLRASCSAKVSRSTHALGPGVRRCAATNGNTACTSSGRQCTRPASSACARAAASRARPARGDRPMRICACAAAGREQRLHVVDQRRAGEYIRAGGAQFQDLRRRRGRATACPITLAAVGRAEHRALGVAVRITQAHAQHEAVQLRIGQRIGAGEVERVLRRHHEERRRQPVRDAVHGDLMLGHRLEQRALRLRRRAVDLVGEQQLREQRAGMEAEPFASRSKMLTPMMSDGSRSDVNCTRWNSSPSVAASACASVVLPTPGRSSISRWPSASRQAKARRTSPRLPSTTVLTWAIARANASRSSVGKRVTGISLMAWQAGADSGVSNVGGQRSKARNANALPDDLRRPGVAATMSVKRERADRADTCRSYRCAARRHPLRWLQAVRTLPA